MFTTRFEAWVRRRAEALMRAVGRIPITPNQITVIGVALTFVAAVLVAFGYLRWAGIALIVGGTFDILDGALARGAAFRSGGAARGVVALPRRGGAIDEPSALSGSDGH